MKMFLLEPDKKVVKELVDYLNSTRTRFDIEYIYEEEKIFQATFSFPEYDIFVLNLKDPINTHIKRYIRNNGGSAPILLILEAELSPSRLETIYYLKYDCIIYKKFFPQEIAFHIYKLCNIWNDKIYFLTKEIYFDYRESTFVYEDQKTHLGRKEALLLKLLLLQFPCYASYKEIEYYVYLDEVVTQESIRSLVRQLRNKLPCNMIETVTSKGYKITNVAKEHFLILTLAQVVNLYPHIF